MKIFRNRIASRPAILINTGVTLALVFLLYTLFKGFLVDNVVSSSSCQENKHSVCFIGKRFCHPGYTGKYCSERLHPANPWYSKGCPNLKQEITFDIDMPLESFYTPDNCSSPEISGITGCANLCFSHPISGIPQIPMSFWKRVQQNENNVWAGMGGGSDRGGEHLEGFNNYAALPGLKIINALII